MPQTATAHVIPKLLHRIWFGPTIPEVYQKNLVQLIEKNSPRYTVHLWTDVSLMSDAYTQRLRTFAERYKIVLHDIRENTQLINYELILEELNKTILHQGEQDFQPRVHYARASDLARVAILIEQGGIYTDTDTQSREPLPALHANYGILLKKKQASHGLSKEKQDELSTFKFPDFTDVILYDFIAATPHNEVLLLAAEVSKIDYAVYHRRQQESWEYIDCHEFHIQMTMMLTGSALRCAVNHFTMQTVLPSDKSTALFFDDHPFFHSTYDKSWLNATNIESESEETLLKHFVPSPRISNIMERFGEALLCARKEKFSEPADFPERASALLPVHVRLLHQLTEIARYAPQQCLPWKQSMAFLVAILVSGVSEKIRPNAFQSLAVGVMAYVSTQLLYGLTSQSRGYLGLFSQPDDVPPPSGARSNQAAFTQPG
jgi:hypothetical protein